MFCQKKKKALASESRSGDSSASMRDKKMKIIYNLIYYRNYTFENFEGTTLEEKEMFFFVLLSCVF